MVVIKYVVLANNVCNCNNTIVGGANNCVFGGCFSFIGAGCLNKSLCSSRATVIGGGDCNFTCAHYGVIGGGLQNTITCTGCCSGILGGYSNCVNGHDHAFIVGCNITTTTNNYTFVSNLCNVNGGTSDCRLKENINPIPYGLTQVVQLEPVSYNFKKDCSKALKYGFLAQCVQNTMPNFIKNHPTDLVDGTPVLQFEKEAVFSTLVNAIKDLKTEIDSLKARITELEG